jgi:hypothetical protein
MLKGFTAPRSPLGVAALVPPPPWHFAGDVLAVEFWNDPDLSLKSFRWVSNLTRNVRGTPSHFSQTTNLPRRTMSISTPPDIKVAAFAFRPQSRLMPTNVFDGTLKEVAVEMVRPCRIKKRSKGTRRVSIVDTTARRYSR